MGQIKYKSVAIAFFATIVRYYDYGLFGMSAAILSKTYIPASDEKNQLLSFFAIFSASVLLRPLGSIIFGKIGDKLGRVESVKIAAIMAALATIMIGIIPSSSEIGLWAAMLLAAGRIIFLISLAGEIDAVKIYIAEMVGSRRRYFASSLVTFSAQLGVLIAAAMYHYSQSDELSEHFREYLWRYNFIAGGIAGILVFLLRKSLVENEVFLKSKKRVDAFDDMSLLQIIRHSGARFIAAMIMNGMLGGVYHFLIIFLATFTGNVAGLISADEASKINIKLIAIYGLSSIAAGVLADRVCYYKQTLISIALSLGVMILMIYNSTGYEAAVAGGQAGYAGQYHKIAICIAPFFMVPSYIKIQSLFAGKVRMRMYSLSHSLGSMIFSSTTPLFCSLLWNFFHLYSIVLSFYAIQMIILFVLILYIRKQDYKNEFEN